jgi:hypothetical protein
MSDCIKTRCSHGGASPTDPYLHEWVCVCDLVALKRLVVERAVVRLRVAVAAAEVVPAAALEAGQAELLLAPSRGAPAHGTRVPVSVGRTRQHSAVRGACMHAVGAGGGGRSTVALTCLGCRAGAGRRRRRRTAPRRRTTKGSPRPRKRPPPVPAERAECETRPPRPRPSAMGVEGKGGVVKVSERRSAHHDIC